MTDTATIALPVNRPRRRELLFGTGFLTAGVLVAFATLIGTYLEARSAAGSTWLEGVDIPLTQPNMMLVTIAMSAVAMQWVVYSINSDDRYHAYMAMGLTLLLGAAFVNQGWFLFTQIGMTMSQPEGPLFYAVTAGHLALVVAAMAFLVLMGLRTLGGQFSSRHPDGMSAAAIVWYAACVLFVVIWFAVYVQK